LSEGIKDYVRVVFERVKKLEPELDKIKIDDTVSNQKVIMHKIEDHFTDKGGYK